MPARRLLADQAAARLRAAGVASPEHDARGAAGPRARRRAVPARARRRRTGPHRRAVRRAGRAPRGPRAAPAPDRGRPLPLRRPRGGPRGVRAAARDRAARRLGGRLGHRPDLVGRHRRARRGRPRHRLGRDRQGRGPRGAPGHGCTRSSSTSRPMPGPPATWRPPASTCGRATWPTPSTTWPAPSTSSSATLPTSRTRPGSPWPPRPATTTPRWRSGRPATGSTRSAWSSSARRVLLRPGGVLGVEHADAQGESAPAVLSGTGRWEQVRDHSDLAGRARFVTARLAR